MMNENATSPSISIPAVKNNTDELSLTMFDNLHLPMLIPWSLAYAVVAVFVVFGNSLVIICFIKTKSLRTHTNYFIVSLSVVDLFVGVISVPWWIFIMFVKYQGEEWLDLLHNIWLVFDILGGAGSILHLIALSWDRLCAIVWPLKHRKYSSKSYLNAVILVWIVAVFVSALAIIWKTEVIYHVTVIVLFFFVPLIVICVTQFVIVIFISKQVQKMAIKPRLRKDIKVAKTIGIMIAIFVLGWFPFFSFSLVSYTNPDKKMSWHALFAVKLLQYGNSAINPALYAPKFPLFRKAYVAILCSCIHVNKFVRPIRNWSSRFSRASAMTSSTRLSLYGSVKSSHKTAAERRRLTREESFLEATGSPTMTRGHFGNISGDGISAELSPDSHALVNNVKTKIITPGPSILKTDSKAKYRSERCEGEYQSVIELHEYKGSKKRSIKFLD